MIKYQIQNKNCQFGFSDLVFPVIIQGKNNEKMLALFTKNQIKVALKRGNKYPFIQKIIDNEKN